MRTPVTDASDVIARANTYLNWFAEETGLVDQEGNPIQFNFFSAEDDVKDTQDDEGFQEGIEDILRHAGNAHRNGEKPNGFFPFLIAVLHAKQALKICESANKNNDSNNLAWSFIADAQYWLGIATTIMIRITNDITDKKQMTERMGAVRHAENRDIKKTVFEYYEANMSSFKSKDHAAESIAGSLVPVKFRTVRSYIDEFHKKKTAS